MMTMHELYHRVGEVLDKVYCVECKVWKHSTRDSPKISFRIWSDSHLRYWEGTTTDAVWAAFSQEMTPTDADLEAVEIGDPDDAPTNDRAEAESVYYATRGCDR